MGVLTYLLSSFAAAVLGQSSLPLVRRCRWRFKAIPLRGEVAGIWTDLVRALRMCIRVSFTGLGTGREGNAACIFRGLLNARGLLLFPKKDRLCKGHMQDMPIPHAFWQPA